jgi:hypothetical protein
MNGTLVNVHFNVNPLRELKWFDIAACSLAPVTESAMIEDEDHLNK